MPAAAAKPSKNQLRRARKKAKKDVSNADSEKVPSPKEIESKTTDDVSKTKTLDGESSFGTDINMDDPLWGMYKNIAGRFEASSGEETKVEQEKPQIYFDDDDEIPDEEENEPRMSKKKRKEMTKLSVAELKALVQKPDLVEWTDTSAPDPRLLVHIKAHRNVVPVPTHWSLKREYLSSKRGIEKAAFSLPKFIQETGIAEMRDAAQEKQEQSTLKQKQRERVAPKMGRLDIDYQKLYEAFFRFQTKPELTRYGEVYYEGKEYETNLRHLRPGELSDELKEALNIPPGAPPPWLINQQRYGPPPSYPALKIPGLNAPPPAGAMWGYHPGGYGKPPVDEHNRPLYGGDIFGVLQTQQSAQQGEPIEKDLWGELQPPEEESEEESEEEEEEDEEAEDEDMGEGLQTPSGLETPSGFVSTVPSEIGAVESVGGEFDVRKHHRGTETEESIQPRAAYRIIPEQQSRVQGFFGGDRKYDLKAPDPSIPVLGAEDHSRKRRGQGDVDVSMDPDMLQSSDGINKEHLQGLYNEERQQEHSQWNFQEDLSDMIASESPPAIRSQLLFVRPELLTETLQTCGPTEWSEIAVEARDTTSDGVARVTGRPGEFLDRALAAGYDALAHALALETDPLDSLLIHGCHKVVAAIQGDTAADRQQTCVVLVVLHIASANAFYHRREAGALDPLMPPSRFAGDSSRPSYPPRSPRRDQPPSPPSRYRDYPSPSRSGSIRERPPPYGRSVGRSRSPYYRNEQYSRNDSHPRRRTRSPVKAGLSDHPSSHNSASTSRRSSPPANLDRPSGTPSRPRSRSPVDLTSRIKAKSVERAPAPSSAVGSSSHSSHDNARNSPLNNSAQERAISERSDKVVADRPGLSPRPSVSSDKADYPKGPGVSDSRGSQQETTSGTSTSSAPNRASNISLLSAPTRPKGASNYHSRDHNRDPTWTGRRAPPPPPPLQQTPPTGPRNRYVQTPPVNDLQRGPGYRPSSGPSVPHHQRSPRPNYLASLPVVVAGGRLLPPTFDVVIEKRLSQLESDEDKLVDQVLEKQRSKRVGLKDWNRLERESALNALKSELAEVHLQRMTEGEGFEGATVF
ncbi:Pre-mRNA-splicing factor sap145 [Talaromyces islandicus]|uniref:Pre-mRNA-splicing factor sap145 n=1 Tax=Talaromyces islandicus TaxID=28573 RepID=A0A0U1LJP6_TALIS|nr:Pre-mRNA-splicing factor sap145 [Talaromyces islandicus]